MSINLARMSMPSVGLLQTIVTLSCFEVSDPVRYGIAVTSMSHFWMERVGEELVWGSTV